MKKGFLRVVVGTILFFLSFIAHSAENDGTLELGVGIGSVHEQKRADGNPWNETNNGVAVYYRTPGVFFGKEVEYCATVGQIQNSEFGKTAYVGGCIRKILFEGSMGNVSLGVFAGVMTYPSKYNTLRKSSDLFPVILPTISGCMANGLCLDATVIPKVDKNQGSSAVLFMVRFPLN